MNSWQRIFQFTTVGLIFFNIPAQAQPQRLIPKIDQPKYYHSTGQPDTETKGTELTQDTAKLFGTTIDSLKSTQVRQTSSKLTVTGTYGSVTMSIVAQAQTISQAPNQFRSKVSFANSEGQGKVYEIVSNGKSVWLYDTKTRRFSIQPYKSFDDEMWVGLLSSFSLRGTPLPIDKGSSYSNLETLQEAGLSFLGQQTASNNKNYAVFNMSLPEKKMVYPKKQDNADNGSISFWIDPQKEQIDFINLVGRYKGGQFKFEETILEQKNNVSAPLGGFTFHPPVGARQVKKQEIELFPS